MCVVKDVGCLLRSLQIEAHLARPLFVGPSPELQPVLAREFPEASFVGGDKARAWEVRFHGRLVGVREIS